MVSEAVPVAVVQSWSWCGPIAEKKMCYNCPYNFASQFIFSNFQSLLISQMLSLQKKMNFVQDFYLQIRLLRNGQQNIIMAFFITHRLCFTFYNLLCWCYYVKIKRAILWHESICSFISMICFFHLLISTQFMPLVFCYTPWK